MSSTVPFAPLSGTLGYARGKLQVPGGTHGGPAEFQARSRDYAASYTVKVSYGMPRNKITDPLKLEPLGPVLTASQVLKIGRNQTYRMVRDGTYPVPVHVINGRFKVSKYDVLRYLGVPGYRDDTPAKQAS